MTRGCADWNGGTGNSTGLIPLPEGAKTDQVTAQLHDGVLKISMPAAEKKGRQVPVDKAAAA
jgi:HSP20 family molecular chaperone IbpA